MLEAEKNVALEFRTSIVSPAAPHAEPGFLDGLGVAITETGVVTVAVALRDVALGRVPGVGGVTQERRTEAGVVPSIHLLQAPDFENIGAAVADGDGPRRVLN